MELVQKEVTRNFKRIIVFYNLDATISVGHRGNSLRATHFRSIKNFHYLRICIRQRKNKKRQQYVAKCSLHNL